MITCYSQANSSKESHRTEWSLKKMRLNELLNPMKVKVTQSCLTRCDPQELQFLQAKILKWVAFPFSQGSSQLRDWTQVFCIAGGFFTSWATREALSIPQGKVNISTVACLPAASYKVSSINENQLFFFKREQTFSFSSKTIKVLYAK